MANEKAHDLLQFRPWPPGDPWVLIEAVLREVDDPGQQRKIMGFALDTVAATLQANLQLVNNIKQVVAGSR